MQQILGVEIKAFRGSILCWRGILQGHRKVMLIGRTFPPIDLLRGLQTVYNIADITMSLIMQ